MTRHNLILAIFISAIILVSLILCNDVVQARESAFLNTLELVENAAESTNSIVISHMPVSITVTEENIAKFSVIATGTGLCYQWQYRTGPDGAWNNSGASGNKTNQISFRSSNSQNGYQYRCIVSNNEETVYTSEAVLTVLTKPIIATHPDAQAVVEGNIVKFEVVVIGNQLSYQWQYRVSSSGNWNNSGASGNKTSKLSFRASSSQNGYQYRCKVSNGKTVVYSKEATLTVNSVLYVIAQPESRVVTEGSIVKFGIVAGGDNLCYQWQYRTSSSENWVNSGASGNKTASLSFKASILQNGYQYRCKVYNNASMIYTNSALLTVLKKPTHRALLIGNQNYSSGELPGCHNDMYAMAGMLKSLTNKYNVTQYPDANAFQMIDAINSVFAEATEQDISLFYYSGHGTSNGSLCGVDRTYLKPVELAAALSAIPGKVIVILDSCFSGTIIANDVEKETIKRVLTEYNQRWIDAFTAVDNAALPRHGELYGQQKFIVITASAYNEESYSLWDPTIGNSSAYGYFTRNFVEGCGTEYYSGGYSGNPMAADSNNDKRISVSEIYNYTYSKTNDYQTAQCYAHNMNDILFSR